MEVTPSNLVTAVPNASDSHYLESLGRTDTPGLGSSTLAANPDTVIFAQAGSGIQADGTSVPNASTTPIVPTPIRPWTPSTKVSEVTVWPGVGQLHAGCCGGRPTTRPSSEAHHTSTHGQKDTCGGTSSPFKVVISQTSAHRASPALESISALSNRMLHRESQVQTLVVDPRMVNKSPSLGKMVDLAMSAVNGLVEGSSSTSTPHQDIRVRDSNISVGGDFASNNNNINIGIISHSSVEDVLRPIRDALAQHVVDDARLDYSHTPCYPGTRKDLLDQLARWIIGEPITSEIFSFPPSKQCVCIFGRPGSGKSTIATSIVTQLLHKIPEQCPGFVSAHYFIRRQSKHTTDRHKVFPTIAEQLATQSRSVAQALTDVLTSNQRRLDITPRFISEENQQRLLIEPIQAYSGVVLVLIDAIDEISDLPAFSYSLSRVIPNIPPNMRLILTTRNEQDILRTFGADLLPGIKLEITTEESVDEVSLFIQNRLLDGLKAYFGDRAGWCSWPSAHQLSKLSSMADGLYVYARTVVDYILSMLRVHGFTKRDRIMRSVTKVRMKDLDGLYMFILDQACGEDDHSIDPDRVAAITRLLGLMTVSKSPQELKTIKEYLEFDYPDFDVLRFVERARSILVSGTVPITPLTRPQTHKSFTDFITSDRAGRFQIIVAPHHGFALTSAFKCMNSRLRFNLCELESSFISNDDLDEKSRARITSLPASLVYASNHWGYHLTNAHPQFQPPLTEVRKLLHKNLLFWLEIVSLRGSVEDAVTSISVLRNWLDSCQCLPRAGVTKSEAVSSSRSCAGLANFARDAARVIRAFREVIRTSAPHVYISLLAFSPRDSIVASHYRDAVTNTVIPLPAKIPPDWGLWKYRPGKMNDCDDVRSVSFSSCSRRLVAGYCNGGIRIWDVETGDYVLGPWDDLGDGSGEVNSVCFSPEGDLIASGTDDGVVRLWDATGAGRATRSLKGHTELIRAVSFSTDGRYLASASDDVTIRIWDRHTGATCLLLDYQPFSIDKDNAALYCVSFSPNGLYVASGSQDGTVQFWDLRNGTLIHGSLEQRHSDFVYTISFSPDGRRVISGSGDKSIRIWDPLTGACIFGPIEGHRSEVTSVSFSPDTSTLIASGSNDRTIRIWNAETGKRAAGPLGGHNDSVFSIAFSPDGRYLASGSWDGTIRIWDVDSILRDANIVYGVDGQPLSSSRLTDQSLLDVNGWMIGSRGERLFWSPNPLREAICRPSTTKILGWSHTIDVDLSQLCDGREWLNCFPKSRLT